MTVFKNPYNSPFNSVFEETEVIPPVPPFITDTQRNVYLLNDLNCLASTTTQEMLDLDEGMDFWRGLNSTPSTDDPAITGTAGVDGIYMSTDGGDKLTSKAIATGFMNNVHRPLANGGSFQYTAILAVRTSSSTLGTLFSSVDNTNSAAEAGVSNLFDTNIGFSRGYQAGATIQGTGGAFVDLGINTLMILAFVVDLVDPTSTTLYVYKAGVISNTLNYAAASSTTWAGVNTNPTNEFSIFNNGTNQVPLPSGFRLYGACFADSALSAGDALTAMQNMETLLGVTF